MITLQNAKRIANKTTRSAKYSITNGTKEEKEIGQLALNFVALLKNAIKENDVDGFYTGLRAEVSRLQLIWTREQRSMFVALNELADAMENFDN